MHSSFNSPKLEKMAWVWKHKSWQNHWLKLQVTKKCGKFWKCVSFVISSRTLTFTRRFYSPILTKRFLSSIMCTLTIAAPFWQWHECFWLGSDRRRANWSLSLLVERFRFLSLSLWSSVGPPGDAAAAHRARFFITWPRGVQKPQPRSRRAVHHWPAIRGISAAAYAEYAPRQHHNNLTEKERSAQEQATHTCRSQHQAAELYMQSK